MKALNKFPPEYFLKYKEKPVKIKPFNPKAKVIAEDLIKDLFDLGVNASLIGSTAYGISGQGDVEVAVYPEKSQWKKILTTLEEKYGKPLQKENDFVQFGVKDNEFDLCVNVLKGYEAKVINKLTEYMLSRPDLILEYEKLKVKYSYSRREYQIQKNKFLTEVTINIPEEKSSA
jgi:hypothetical protein